ncbi:MAG: ATP phosphoribosyltransferase regulatory subunit, partial [Nitrospirales bacterium]|nr:ATP phosphoribosyltransferase regulatory subunit [Nitrospirales bacterium]
YELGGGGRYDHLLGKFGRSLPSTGFALDMDRVFAALDQREPQTADGTPPILLVGPQKLYSQTFRLAERLRRLGVHVIQETIQGEPSQYFRHARERGRSLATTTVILLGAPGLSKEVVQVLDGSSKRTRPKITQVPIQELPAMMKAPSYADF